MVVEPVVVLRVDPSVVTTPTRAEVVMADELAPVSVLFPPLVAVAEALEPVEEAEPVAELLLEESAPANEALIGISQCVVQMLVLTCAVLRAIGDHRLGLLSVGTGLVGAVADSVTEVG